MPNHTPNHLLPGWAPVVVPRKCGWCCSSHVANAECICEEECSSSWCPKGGDIEMGQLL